MTKFPFLLLALSATCLPLPCAAEEHLFGEGPQLRKAHRFLFEEFIQGREVQFAGDTPGKRSLKRLVVWSGDPIHVNGDLHLPLAEGTEQVMHMFRHIEIRGAGLTGLGPMSLHSHQPGVGLERSAKESHLYRAKTPGLPPPDASTPRSVIHVAGTGRIDKVTLLGWTNGVPETFDELPYRNLGHDKPPRKVSLRIDPATEHSLEGHIALDRSKWFRYYGSPGGNPPALEEWAKERGFSPGRQMTKLQPALVKGYSSKQPKLREDPQRPGYAEPGFFDEYTSATYRNTRRDWPDLKFAMCFNDWPEFMAMPDVGRGTPKAQHFPAATELAVNFFKDQIRDGGRTATWWELKNESTVKSEWDYHWRKDVDSWGLLSRFHNMIADAVHKEVPGVKIGGPASAWMQVQASNFDLWRNQVRFMDETRGHLDFYSHHFYEDVETLGAFERLDDGYSNYLLGRLDAVMDMFDAHMSNTGNERPILITEYGSLNVGTSDAEFWLHLRSYNAYLMQWMERPHQFDLTVPFIFVSCPWDPMNGHAAFVPKENPGANRYSLDHYDRTPNAWFFDFWRDFSGRRLVAQSGSRWLHALVLHEGKRIQVALNNMSSERMTVDLGKLASLPGIESVSHRRLYRINGKITYVEAAQLPRDLSAIPVEVEETAIVTITLSAPLDPKKISEQHTFYAAETAVPLSDQDPDGFVVALPQTPRQGEAVELIVGIHRRGGLSEPIRGTLNGTPFEKTEPWAREIDEFFATVRIPVSPEAVRARNLLKFESRDPGVTLTSAGIRVHRPRGQERP